MPVGWGCGSLALAPVGCIRIIVDGTVFDATIDGLLQQKTMIESMLMAALKQAIKQNSHQDTSDHG